MYFVGIDISKFKHDCAIIDEIGDVIMPLWSFNNDLEGFSIFPRYAAEDKYAEAGPGAPDLLTHRIPLE